MIPKKRACTNYGSKNFRLSLDILFQWINMVKTAALSGICISPTLHCIFRHTLPCSMVSRPFPMAIKFSAVTGKYTYRPSIPPSRNSPLYKYYTLLTRPSIFLPLDMDSADMVFTARYTSPSWPLTISSQGFSNPRFAMERLLWFLICSR